MTVRVNRNGMARPQIMDLEDSEAVDFLESLARTSWPSPGLG